MTKYQTPHTSYMPGAPIPLCPCGCGQHVTVMESGLLLNRTASEACRKRLHAQKIAMEKERMDGLSVRPFCACGCEQMVSWKMSHRTWNRFFHGHSNRIRYKKPKQLLIKFTKRQKERGYCHCGCGERVLHPGEKYLRSHYGIMLKAERLVRIGPAPLCKCGCGKHVNYGKSRWNTYVKGHEHRDLEYLARIQNSLNSSPNKLERTFDSLTADEIEFVGDGWLWVSLPDGRYKNPDFRVKGKKQVIELFGDRWHRPEEQQEIEALYLSAGYQCLVIWEHEMRDVGVVLGKVADFTGIREWQLPLDSNYRQSRYQRKESVECLIE